MWIWAWILLVAVGTEYFLKCTGSSIETEVKLTDDDTLKQEPQFEFFRSFDAKIAPKIHQPETDMGNADQHTRIERTVGKCLMKVSEAMERKKQRLKEIKKASLQKYDEKVKKSENLNQHDEVIYVGAVQPSKLDFNAEKELMKSGPEHNDNLIEKMKQLVDKSAKVNNLRRQEFYRNLTSHIINHTKGDVTTKSLGKEEISSNNYSERNPIERRDHFDNIETRGQFNTVNENRNDQNLRFKSESEKGIGNRKERYKEYKRIIIEESARKSTNNGIKMKCICEPIIESSRTKRDLQQRQEDRNKISGKRSQAKSKEKLKFNKATLEEKSKSSVNRDRKYRGSDVKVRDYKSSSSVGCNKQHGVSIIRLSQKNKSNNDEIENILSRFVKINLELERLMTLYGMYKQRVEENRKIIRNHRRNRDVTLFDSKTYEDSSIESGELDERSANSNLNLDYDRLNEVDRNLMNLYNKFETFIPKIYVEYNSNLDSSLLKRNQDDFVDINNADSPV